MAIILKVAKHEWSVAMLRKLAILVISAGLIISPLSVQALGFGGIKLKSSLNEKLNAEVALLSASQSDIQSLKIKLATDEAFLRAGISRTAFLSGINYKVKQYSNGDYYIHLTTKESVREPFLDFLLDINWKNGRMLREYTMLLDPPGREAKQTFDPSPTPVVTETITPVVPVIKPKIRAREIIKSAVTNDDSAKDLIEAKKAEEIAKAIEESFIKAANASEKFDPKSAFAEEDSGELWPRIPLTDYDDSDKKKPVNDAGSLDYGIVKEDDNLWKIAEKLRQGNKNISIYQVMMALLQSNPDAFTDNNIHRLNVGHVLRIDDASALTRLTRKEAANAYIKQTSAWNQYRKQVAGVQPIIASDDVKTKTKTTNETSGELTLSSPDGKSLISGGGTNEESLNNDLATMQAQLRQTKTDAGTMRSRNTELNEKLQLLEGELNRLQRSISVKDDELAALQHQLSGSNTTTAVKPDVVKETVVKKTTDLVKANKSPVELAAEIAAAEKEQVVAETDAGIMGIITGIGAAVVGVFAGDSLLIIAPLLLFLLIIIGIMIRRKRQGDKFQESILTGVATAETKSDTNDGSSEFLESSFLSDFAMSGAGAIEADDSEVDPLTEADVFIAYGRFEAAEERLNEAVQNEPERLDLRAKMLELHHATKNKDAFEAGAEDFYASLGGNEAEEPLWQKIVDLGIEVAPKNPLFVQDIIEDEAVTKEQDIDEPNVASMSDSQVMDIGLETGVFEASDLDSSDKTESDMDFNLDLGDELEAFNIDEPIPEEDDDLEFNLELDGEETTSEEVTAEEDTAEIEEGTLDFNIDTTTIDAVDEDDMALDFSLDNVNTEISNEESTVESDDGNSLDFNLDMDTDKSTDEIEIDLDLDDELSTTDNSLDFNVEETATEKPTNDLDLSIEESSDDLDLDFKLDDEAEIETDIEEETSEFDLSLSEDMVELETESPTTEEETSLNEDDDLELGSSDEVGTKLDLAKAYIDMGDPEGARSILSEVMDEGSDKQKEEAHVLLGQIV